MPIADLYIFIDDRLHHSVASSLLTASSTVSGYAIDNVRDPDLSSAWKGNDSTTVDEYLQVDGGSTTWLGSTPGETAFCVIAYDGRGSEQDNIKLNQDVADSPVGAFVTTRATFAVNKSEVSCAFSSVLLSNPTRRYYRLLQPGTERTEAAGTITSKVLIWGMFASTGVVRLSVDYPNDTEGGYDMEQFYNIGQRKTAGGHPRTNKRAAAGQRYSVRWAPGKDATFESLRDKLFSIDGPHRAVFVQKEGLRNPAQADFFLCRMASDKWRASKRYEGQYEFDIELETMPWL